MTFLPPGGDGSADALGSGNGLAVAAVPPLSRDAARAPAARAAAAARRDLDR
ncbi:hypothetical protein [Streptomyces bauhiniae]